MALRGLLLREGGKGRGGALALRWYGVLQMVNAAMGVVIAFT